MVSFSLNVLIFISCNWMISIGRSRTSYASFIFRDATNVEAQHMKVKLEKIELVSSKHFVTSREMVYINKKRNTNFAH